MTPLESVLTSHGAQDCRVRDLACQQSVEILIDDMADSPSPRAIRLPGG